MLYPLKFKPIFHYRIWGGKKLKTFLHKEYTENSVGESWEISSLPNYISVVENGYLKGKNLNELILTYKEELLGAKIWKQFGTQFPLLIKFIDTNAPLSVQVHPDNIYAKERHKSLGKTEMWYIMDCEKDAELIIGNKKNTTKEIFQQKLKDGKIEEMLNSIHIKEGDAFYIPAGRIHAIGKGITLAEIQQNSDITYRIYDFDRIDKDGNKRELHLKDALQVSDFSYIENPKIEYISQLNSTTPLSNSPFFNITKTNYTHSFSKSFSNESFTILIFTNGEGEISWGNNQEPIKFKKGDVLLLPASLGLIDFNVKYRIEFLEVFL